MFHGYYIADDLPRHEFTPRKVKGINCKWGIGYDEQPIKWARKKGYLKFNRGGVGGRRKVTGASLSEKGYNFIFEQAKKRKHLTEKLLTPPDFSIYSNP